MGDATDEAGSAGDGFTATTAGSTATARRWQGSFKLTLGKQLLFQAKLMVNVVRHYDVTNVGTLDAMSYLSHNQPPGAEYTVYSMDVKFKATHPLPTGTSANPAGWRG